MSDKLVEARKLLEKTYDLSVSGTRDSRFKNLKAAVYAILQHLEEAEG